MKSKLAISMEAIGFQSDVFFKELTGYFEDIKKTGRSTFKKEKLSDLAKIIKHHTNINVTVETREGEGINRFILYALTPAVNANGALAVDIAQMFKGQRNDTGILKKGIKKLHGYIDLKAGRVDGIYAELNNILVVPTHAIFFFEPAEIAAMVLHEVGHILTNFENVTRVVTTNFAMKSVSDAILAGSDASTREHILLDLTEALRMPKVDVKELAKFDNADAVQVAILNNAVEAARSELGSNVYDIVGCEALADQYAARCGAYRDLVIGLSKAEKAVGNNFAFRSSARYFMMESLKVAFAIVPFLIPVTLLMTAADSTDAAYDKPRVRFERIREQLVAEIKQTNIKPERIKQLQEDVKLIDGVLAEVQLRPQFFEWVGNVFSSRRREKVKIEEFHRQIEKMGNNDLFLKARELQTL